MDRLDEKIIKIYEDTVLKPIYEGQSDQGSADELGMYVDNDSNLHRQMVVPWQKNLMAKLARGIFDYKKAVMGLAKNLFTEGAKRYAKDYGNSNEWSDIFSVPTRKIAAESWLDSFLEEAEIGNYNDLLPKKYKDTEIDYNSIKK